MKKVFLAGTTNGSTWRDELIELLKIDFFNPLDIQKGNKKDEINQQKESCDYLLYVITPKMSGFFNIAEAVDFSNKYPHKTIFCSLPADGQNVFSKFEIKSLNAVGKMILKNGSQWFKDIDKLVKYLNNKQ